MNPNRTRPLLFSLLSFISYGVFFTPQASWAVRPMDGTVALVAGVGSPGGQDGDFLTASFKTPQGLAINTDGTELFIADTGNNRIRVVHLDQDDNVTTLTGKDTPGTTDGPLGSALFKQPKKLLYLPGDRLVVQDSGNSRIRLVDLKAGTVTTLAPTVPDTAKGPAKEVPLNFQDMAYLAGADSLLLSNGDQGGLKKLDLKTSKLSPVTSGPGNLINQMGANAILASEKYLYVAEREKPVAYRMEWTEKGFTDPVSVGSAKAPIISFVENGDILYALQYNGDFPLYRVVSSETGPCPVSIISVWGDPIPNPGGDLPSLMDVHNYTDTIVPDPLDCRKFYICNSYWNIVSSFRDLFGNMWAGGDDRALNGLNEPEYPIKKPPKTYRILLVGDSRPTMIVHYSFEAPGTYPTTAPSRKLIVSKRMELELNTLAAIEDQPLNYEVLTLTHSGSNPIFHWPYYEVPPLVVKDDIDLVVVMMDPPTGDSPLRALFMAPLTKEGILPSYYYDPEYSLKPYQERIVPELRDFYNKLKERNMVTIEKNTILPRGDLDLDLSLHDTIAPLYGKPLSLLNKKLAGMKTSSGKPVKFLLLFTPIAPFHDFSAESKLWTKVAKIYDIPFLNLYDEMTALRLTYYPMAEESWDGHFTVWGHLFLGSLITHDLIRGGYIPWTNNAPVSQAAPKP